jgi:hypothetical protein
MKLNTIYTAAASLIVILVTPLSALAQTEATFKTPSKNIYCSADESYLRCQMLEIKAKIPPKPTDCNLDWGYSFGMEAKGKAGRSCYGDTIVDPNYPVLDYGKTWRSNGFTCVSQKSGLTCTNKDKKGWRLSVTQQKLF